jgi:hypothetical protein
MKFERWHYLIMAVLVVFTVSAIVAREESAIFLPGTQPGVVETFDSPLQCIACHDGENSGVPVTIGSDWRGSMMGHSARDPIFYAAMAIANKYRDGSGEFCIRCHSPGGWLEGRSDPPTGQGLTGADLEGVQCDACHRFKDSAIPDTTADPPVPGYGNGMMVMQVPLYPKRGPFADAFQFHDTVQDTFQVSSDFCGTCHNVSNPFYADDPLTQSPHEYSPIERTYSEWLLSSFPARGEQGTCQSCHMRREPGYGCIVPGAPYRQNIPRHDLTGGNTFVPDILFDFWGSDVDTAALRRGKDRALATLQSAASLEVMPSVSGDTVLAEVRITNLTGHKLPTGYPEGRRMWLNVVGRDAVGDTVFESGRYDFSTADLIIDGQARVYEAKAGLTEATAMQYGLDAGPSFHFVLNDTFYFDNRIPPEGFSNAAFASHHAEPVGHNYADGQYWDLTNYAMPSSVATISVVLYYQTASKEYITFLRDENVGNSFDWNAWGDSLYAAWERRGKSKPVIMDSVTVPVQPTWAANQETLPTKIALEQNYPNPFNGETGIRFEITDYGLVRLRVYDLAGRHVMTVVNGLLPAGKHNTRIDASRLASGVYLIRLEAGNHVLVRKMVLLR